MWTDKKAEFNWYIIKTDSMDISTIELKKKQSTVIWMVSYKTLYVTVFDIFLLWWSLDLILEYHYLITLKLKGTGVALTV